MIHVLLVSPRAPEEDTTRCGDHTYTDLLLRYPPPGVVYHHFDDLLASGRARPVRSVYGLTDLLTRLRVLPPDMWFKAVEVDFVPDVLHIHGFSALVRFPRTSHSRPRIILGTSTGSYSDLKYYHGWSPRELRRKRSLKRAYLKYIRAFDSSLSPELATSVLTWSDFARGLHLDEGFVEKSQIHTLYPGLPKPQSVPPETTGNPLTFLFVGRDFDRKNGPMVVDAFRIVHAKYPGTQLLLIGHPKNGETIVSEGVLHRHFVPREELLKEIYPRADVFVLPSRAEGFGLVFLEAMSFGIPSIAVDAWAMPEIIQDGVNGFLIRPNSIDDLVEKMSCIAAQPSMAGRMRRQALRIFDQKFSVTTHNQRLEALYSWSTD